MGSTLVRLLREEQSDDDKESKMEQVMWKKKAIQLDLAKEILVRCICKPCQAPNPLLRALSSSRRNQDAKEDKHDDDDEKTNFTNASGENEELVKLLKVVDEFHEMTEESNRQCLLQKCDDIFLEEKMDCCEAQANFAIASGYVNDDTFKIVRIY
ncbi:hypothetical protein RFI_33497, partial [Reticulomyxa filosa]